MARVTGTADPGLRRLDLENNLLRRALEHTPLAANLLSEEELEATLQHALASPHRTPDVWLFAYGSLVWNNSLGNSTCLGRHFQRGCRKPDK